MRCNSSSAEINTPAAAATAAAQAGKYKTGQRDLKLDSFVGIGVMKAQIIPGSFRALWLLEKSFTAICRNAPPDSLDFLRMRLFTHRYLMRTKQKTREFWVYLDLYLTVDFNYFFCSLFILLRLFQFPIAFASRELISRSGECLEVNLN